MTHSAAFEVSYQEGILAHQLADAVELYEMAFGDKIARAIPQRSDRILLLQAGWQPEFAIGAVHDDTLVGLAGYQTPEGSLTGGMGAGAILRRLGLWRGLRACCVLSLYERTPAPGELVMDGIAVHPNYRGLGIGTELLARIVTFATKNDYDSVRLDVIDTNLAARRLYERCGFRVLREERYPYLARVLGFAGSATMSYEVQRRSRCLGPAACAPLPVELTVAWRATAARALSVFTYPVNVSLQRERRTR